MLGYAYRRYHATIVDERSLSRGAFEVGHAKIAVDVVKFRRSAEILVHGRLELQLPRRPCASISQNTYCLALSD